MVSQSSVSLALLDSQEGEKDLSDLVAIRLQPLPMVSTEELRM